MRKYREEIAGGTGGRIWEVRRKGRTTPESRKRGAPFLSYHVQGSGKYRINQRVSRQDKVTENLGATKWCTNCDHTSEDSV